VSAEKTSRLVPPRDADALVVAGWSRSAEEARRWCSVVEHPFPGERVRGWWAEAGVRPWLLVEGPDARPVGYGELWLDEEEDEVELARLIIDPAQRRRGFGRALVGHLVASAAATGLSGCLLRVAPDNDAAIGLYQAAGFFEVGADRTADWNAGQPAEYRWFEWRVRR
jgi:[ribosomal protein S18]-alanine N-acetyltransferase